MFLVELFILVSHAYFLFFIKVSTFQKPQLSNIKNITL